MNRQPNDIVIWPPAKKPAVWRQDADITSSDTLAAYSESLPECLCGKKIATAHQLIRRSGEILRVDGMTHLELKNYQEHSYKSIVLLECECGELFRPQPGVETYTQGESVKLFDIPERVSEDGEFEGSEELW